MLRFIFKMMKENKKDYFMFTMILSIVVSFLFVFLSMYNVISHIQSEGADIDMAIDLINFLSLGLCVGVVMMINHYFIDEKVQEYAILLLTGRKLREIMFYILIQFGCVLLMSYILGSAMGVIWIILLNKIYSYHHIAFALSYPSLLIYILFFFMIMLLILVYNIARFNKIEMNMSYYLRNKVDTSLSIPSRRPKLYFCLIVIAMLFIVNCMISTVQMNLSSIMSFIGAIIGVMIIIKYLIAFLFYSFHDSFILKSKRLLFMMNGFMELSSTVSIVILINCVMVPIMLICVMLLDIISLKYAIVSCYIFSLLMIMICFVLKFNLYCKNLLVKISTLKSLGYKKRDVQIIQYWQVFIFILMISIPICVYGVVLMNGFHQFLIQENMLILLIMSYIIVYLLISLYMFIKFHLSIKEVY